MKRIAAHLGFIAALLAAPVAAEQKASDMFWVQPTARTPEQAVAAIKAYTEANKWLYLAEFKIKGGEVTSVKICYPPIGKDIFAAGMHVAAFMPCGHIAVYQEGGGTKIAMLHPRFMSVLNPDPNIDRAVQTVTPLFEAMLREVVR